MAKREMKSKDTVVEPEIVEAVVEEELVVEPELDTPIKEEKVIEPIGCVINCVKLNVRKQPKKDAEVLCTLAAKTKVTIDTKGSNKTFYKVTTPTGIEGYCMKTFIAIE